MAPPAGNKRKRTERTSPDDATFSSPSNDAATPHAQLTGPNGDPANSTRAVRAARNSSQPSDSQKPMDPSSIEDSTLMNVDNGPTTAPSFGLDGASDPQNAQNDNFDYPFHYEVLTPERLESWDEHGHQAVRDAFAQAAQSDDAAGICDIFQELIRAVFDEMLDPSIAGHVVKDLIDATSATPSLEPSDLFLDTISILPEKDISNPRLPPFVAATAIPPSLMRLNLEEAALKALGLTRDTFGRMFIRKQTHILYRQSNYNLLREESEGYAKLMTELFTVSQPDKLEPNVVSQTIENVKALIGAFDLDAGRVLDVTLDVFSNMIVKKTRFFVKLLRASPFWPLGSTGIESGHESSLPLWAMPAHAAWTYSSDEVEHLKDFCAQRDRKFWQQARSSSLDAFFGLGGRKVLDEEQKTQQMSAASQDVSQARAQETLEWVQRTGTAPPLGNSTAAQLLGFKLRFYSSSTEDKYDVLPPNLMQLTALLIKIGFISLRDLYAHLHPDDSGMLDAREKQQAVNDHEDRLKSKGESAGNALARAGALSDDTLPAPPRSRATDTRAGTPAVDAKAEKRNAENPLPDSANQKIELLRQLLLLGALPEALYILGRFPWIVDVFRDLPQYINRLLNYSIDQVYTTLYPPSQRSTLSQPAAVVAASQKDVLKPFIRLTDSRKPKSQRWAQLDQADAAGQGSGDFNMRFYWDDWSRDVPVCQSVDDVFTLCDTLLNLSGVRIGQDQALLTKLARIGKHSLMHDNSEPNRMRWIGLLKRIICPAVSFLDANCGVIREIWEILRLFPTHTRYAIYAEWFQGATSRLDAMKGAFSQVQNDTKALLKRINKENVKEKARDLAKLSSACPGVVFDICLKQIESYDNLIAVIIECARYFSELAYDVLSWTLMSFLGRENRSRVSDTGFKANRWLQSLSSFTGQVYKRYALMEPLPILLFIFERIRSNNFVDLRILRDIITSMAGIVSEQKFTDEQLLAMAGGALLRKLTLRQLDDQRHNCGISAKRLMKTLMDHNLAGPILVAIAQQRQTCVYVQDHDDNKILGEIRDETVTVLTQYLDLLLEYLPLAEFAKVVPAVPELIEHYGIDASIAFTIHRKNLSHQITEHDAEHRLLAKSTRPSDTSTKPVVEDVVMTNGDDKAAPEEVVTDAVSTDVLGEIEETATVKPNVNGVSEAASHPILESLNFEMERLLPADVKSSISIPFYTTFWQLDLSDIIAHKTAYDEEHKRQLSQHASLTADKSAKSKEDAKRIIDEILPGLTTEAKAQIKRYSTVRNRMKKEMHFWFQEIMKQPIKLHRGLLQECFMPRVFISPIDAQFASRMLFLMLELGVPGFSLLQLISALFHAKTLQNLIFQCTLEEAENLGRFLHEILKTIGEWHANRTTYESKALGPRKDLPGFAIKFDAEGKPTEFLDYEEFRRFVRRWHQALYMALRRCILSSEYMHARNGIEVLTKISSAYPVISFMIVSLVGTLETVGQREKGIRDDLSTAAHSARARLPKKHQLVQDKNGNLAVGIKVTDFCIEADLDKESSGELVAPAAASPPPKQPNAGDETDVKMSEADRPVGPKPGSAVADKPLAARAPERIPSERPREPTPRNATPQQVRETRTNDGRDSLKRKSEAGREDPQQSPAPDSNKRARLNEAGQAARLDGRDGRDGRPPPHRQGPGARPIEPSHGDYSRPSEPMQPPSMPRSERSFRSSDGGRGPRYQDPNYGRLNQDPDRPASPTNAPGRLSRPDFAAPPVERRQPPPTSHAAPRLDDRGPVRSFSESRGSDNGPPNSRSSAPSTPVSEAPGMHPSRVQQFVDAPPQSGSPRRSPPPPSRPAPNQRSPQGAPSGFIPRGPHPISTRAEYSSHSAPSPTSREPPSGPMAKSYRGPGDGRHQFAQVQETLRQSGPLSAGPRGGPNYDAASSAGSMGRSGRYSERIPESGPSDARRAPEMEPVGSQSLNPERAVMMNEDTRPPHSGRPARDSPRFSGDGPRPPRDFNGSRAPPDRGAPVQGRHGSMAMEGPSGPAMPGVQDRPPLPRNQGPPPSYGNFPAANGPPRQQRTERGDGFGPEGDLMRHDDRRGRPARDELSGFQRPNQPAEQRQFPPERPPLDPPPRMHDDRNADFAGRPTRAPYDDNGHRAGGRPMRRPPGRELMNDATPSALPDRGRPSRPGSMRDRTDQGYGRGDGMMSQRPDMRGGPPNRRGGGPPRHSEGRGGFLDTRGDRRGGDGYGQDRRDISGGGPPVRKREWDGDGAQGDGKRVPPPRRPLNQ